MYYSFHEQGLQTGVLELPCMEALRCRRDPPSSQINMRLRHSNSPIVHLDTPSQRLIFVGDTAQDCIFSNHISERQCSNPHRAMQTQNLSERRVKHERSDHHRLEEAKQSIKHSTDEPRFLPSFVPLYVCTQK